MAIRTIPEPTWENIQNKPAGIESVGMIGYFPSTTPPAGWLKANNQAVLIATYQQLANFLYVGDGNNATATYGYKCTNPGNPTGSRSISGEYIVLPDVRAEFIRGLDDGRGVDAGRTIGSFQADELKSHTHSIYSTNGSTTVSPNNGVTSTGMAGVSGATGGTETRPRNIALLGCIKY